MKAELTLADTVKLDAARGLDLNQSFGNRQYQNNSGRWPSIADYNTAIRRGIYHGDPIIPVGESSES